jgi:hypothetical protein
MDTLEKLQLLLDSFSARQVGHTNLILNGLNNTAHGIVVTHNNKYRKELTENTACDYVSIQNLDKLIGSNKPIVIDNCALSILLSSAINEIENLRLDKELLEDKLKAISAISRSK